jgi:peptide subunit release factor 1 (eRF1)
VAALTQDAIRSLACFKGHHDPVVSLYLDVDGRRHVRPKDYERQLEHLLRQAREQANGSTPHEDLRRIEAHVKAGIDRSRTRGLAIFSCSGQGLWEVIELPMPVRNQLVVNQTPQVKQLETIVDSYERFGVLLADKQRARMLVFELGELVDKSELFDQLPRHDDDHGDWDKDHVRDHSAAQAHHHVRRAAQVAFSVFQERSFGHLIIAAPDEIAHELERELHSYLRDRIAARLTLPVNATEPVIRAAALEVEAQVERARDAALVDRLREAVGSGAGGVAGLEAVLQALVERRVDTLVVSDGFEAPGWRCEDCRFLAVKGRKCPLCGSVMVEAPDVVEEAVEEALTQSCRIAVCIGNADLDVHGRIGALLRF